MGVIYSKDMKEIKLSQEGKNRGKYVALVDDEDFERVNQFRWKILKNKNTYYARRNIRVANGTICVQMHQFIMNGKMVDHIVNNGLNNQKSNLRICTSSQNNMNKAPRENTTSKYKGVYWDKAKCKWVARVVQNYKTTNLGGFYDEIEAAKAYDKKAKELFGEFAWLNFKSIQMQRTKFNTKN